MERLIDKANNKPFCFEIIPPQELISYFKILKPNFGDAKNNITNAFNKSQLRSSGLTLVLILFSILLLIPAVAHSKPVASSIASTALGTTTVVSKKYSGYPQFPTCQNPGEDIAAYCGVDQGNPCRVVDGKSGISFQMYVPESIITNLTFNRVNTRAGRCLILAFSQLPKTGPQVQRIRVCEGNPGISDYCKSKAAVDGSGRQFYVAWLDNVPSTKPLECTDQKTVFGTSSTPRPLFSSNVEVIVETLD